MAWLVYRLSQKSLPPDFSAASTGIFEGGRYNKLDLRMHSFIDYFFSFCMRIIMIIIKT